MGKGGPQELARRLRLLHTWAPNTRGRASDDYVDQCVQKLPAPGCDRLFCVPSKKAPVLRELLKFVVIVAVAGAVGLGLGIGLNQVFGIAKPSQGSAGAAVITAPAPGSRRAGHAAS